MIRGVSGPLILFAMLTLGCGVEVAPALTFVGLKDAPCGAGVAVPVALTSRDSSTPEEQFLIRW